MVVFVVKLCDFGGVVINIMLCNVLMLWWLNYVFCT